MLIVVGTPIVRSVAGWLEKSLADGKIQEYEYKKLFSTVVRLLVPGLALYYGLNVPVEIAAGIPLLADYAYNYVKKLIKKAKEAK